MEAAANAARQEEGDAPHAAARVENTVGTGDAAHLDQLLLVRAIGLPEA